MNTNHIIVYILTFSWYVLFVGRTAPPHFVKVQLGDQTDSRMLLGNYLCTDIPGEFIWQAGILAQVIILNINNLYVNFKYVY